MIIQYEVFGFEALATRVCDEVKPVCEDIISQGRQKEAMTIIEEKFRGKIPTETEVSDFIWEELVFIMGL